MTQHNAALVEQTNAAIEQTESQASELDKIVEVFVVEGAQRSIPERRVTGTKPAALKRLPPKTAAAARSYLTDGNAAIDKDWSEF